MSSLIHYKFKASKAWDPLLFEGASLSVQEAKRQITATKKLHKQAADSDIILSNEQTNEDYEDSGHIPKNSRVIVRRVPATKARTIKFEQTPDATDNPSLSNDAVLPTQPIMSNQQAMMPASNVVNVVSNKNCHKCGSPDHQIKFCPLMQTEYQNRQQPNQPMNSSNANQQPVINPQSAPQSESNRLAAELRCAICHQFYSNAQVVPCCFASFCDECIRQTLLNDNALTCPACHSKPVDLEQLQPNTQLQKAVDEYLSRQHLAAQPRPQNQPPPMQPPMQQHAQQHAQQMQQRPPIMQHPQMMHNGGNQVPPFGPVHPGARFAGPPQPMHQQPINQNRPLAPPPSFAGPMGPMMPPNRMQPSFPPQIRPGMQPGPPHPANMQHPVNMQHPQQHPGQMQPMPRQFVSHYPNQLPSQQGAPNSGFVSQYLNGHPSNHDVHDRQDRNGPPQAQDRPPQAHDRNGVPDRDERGHRAGEQNRSDQFRGDDDRRHDSRDQRERRSDDTEHEGRSQHRPAETPASNEPQTLHTVVSYHLLPCSWNGAPRTVALVVLDNGVRAIAGASLLPSSSFKLGPQYLGLQPNSHLLLARYVPPTNSNSHLLINRAGLEQWSQWQDQGRASFPMPNDFRCVATDCILPWMNQNIELPLVLSQAPNMIVHPSSPTTASALDATTTVSNTTSGQRRVVVRGARSGVASHPVDEEQPKDDRRRSREVFESTTDNASQQQSGKRSVKRRRRSKSPPSHATDAKRERSYSRDRDREPRRNSPGRDTSRREKRNRRKREGDRKREAKRKDEVKESGEERKGRHNVRLRDR